MIEIGMSHILILKVPPKFTAMKIGGKINNRKKPTTYRLVYEYIIKK